MLASSRRYTQLTCAAPGWPLTDIIAAYAYDVFLGRTDADSRGQARLDSLAAQLHRRRAQLAHATPFVRMPPRPLADYAGRFDSPALGAIEILAADGGLRLRWGVLDLPLEVRDAEKQIFAAVDFGGLSPIQFIFGGSGRAEALEVEGYRAVKRA